MASHGMLAVSKTRAGRRPMRVSTLLRKEKDGTLLKYTKLGSAFAEAFQNELQKLAEPPPPKGVSVEEWDRWLQEHPPRSSETQSTQKHAFKLQGHTEVQGIPVSIENRKGSVRKGTDSDGHEWRTEMGYPYGRITGTKGADGEPKVMLGFPTKTEAKKGFLKHYDDPKFLGPVSTVPVEKLKEMVDTGKAMKKISFALGLSKFALLATSPVDVQGVPPKDVNKEILRQSVIAELDASNVYEQMAAKTDDGKIKKILLDVSKEEKTHAGEFQALLHDTDPEQAAEQEAGAQEVCAKTSAVAHTSMLDELVKLNAISALQFEAAKLGPHEKKPIPKAVAQHSLERLRRLEESKASIGEIGRAAGVGALVSPVASLAYRLAAGPKAIGHLGVWRGPRDLLASSVHGSVIGGLVPAGRHKLEREVEKQKLREYVGTHPRGTLRGKIRSTVGV